MKQVIFYLFISIISVILFIPTSSGMAYSSESTEGKIKEQARQLANKIHNTQSNSLVDTINNNGKLIDLKKDNEGNLYLTKHNSNKLLHNSSDNITINSCEFWVKAAVMTVGIVVFMALAMAGAQFVAAFIFGLVAVELGTEMILSLIGLIFSGVSAMFLAEWISDRVCGIKMPANKKISHWDGIPN